MKSKNLMWVLLGLLVLFTAVSCKSKPPAQEETPPVAAPVATEDNSPDQASLSALNAAAARASEARKIVMDFGGPFFFPDEWQFAESLYTQAEQQKNTSTRQSVQESTARYERAASAFEAMIEKTYAAAYQYAISELTYIRNAAISVGAADLIPDYLLEVDNTVLDADRKYQAKDYYGAKDAALKAYSMYDAQYTAGIAYKSMEEAVAAGAEYLIPDLLDSADNVGLNAIDQYLAGDYDTAKSSAEKAGLMYATLKTGIDAYRVREEITFRGLEVYDPQNFGLADDNMWAAADDYMAGVIGPAKDKTEEALLRYNLALKTGWESYAAEMGALASAERQKALDVRANVAVRQEFNTAQAIYVRANTAFQAKDFDQASALYKECQPMFTDTARIAVERRLAAEDALERAIIKIEESDETARSAERILEGGM